MESKIVSGYIKNHNMVGQTCANINKEKQPNNNKIIIINNY